MNFGSGAPSRALVEQRGEGVDVEPLVVLPHLEEGGAEAPDDRDGAEVGGRGDDHAVPFIEEDAADQLEPVLGAVGDDHLPGVEGDAVLGRVLGDSGAELGEPGARGVLQRLAAVRRERAIGLGGEIGEHAGKRVSGVEGDRAGGRRRRHGGRQPGRATRQWKR